MKNNSKISNPSVLTRRVGTMDSIFIIVGSVIGIGIFINHPKVAQIVGNPYWFLLLWVVGGLIALAGALSSAELGVMMPHAGGDYVFLRTAYGSTWSFLYGYLSFVFTYTGSLATMATAVFHYQGHTIFGDVLFTPLLEFHVLSFHYQFNLEHLLAVLLILFLTLINHFGIHSSLLLQKLVTLAPILFLVSAGLVILYKTFFGVATQSLQILHNNFASASFFDFPTFSMVAMAMIYVSWTYTGWNATLYLGEDLKDPAKSIPRSMMISIAIVTSIYVLFCLVILSTIPYSDLMKSNPGDIASRAWGVILGKEAELLMAGLIFFLIVGGMITTILGGSRLYLAMARDGIFFSKAKNIHHKSGSPTFSLWAQAVWSVLIVIVFQEFEIILELTSIFIIFLSIVTVSSVFVMRKRLANDPTHSEEDDKKLYRALGYPYLPILYIISGIIIIVGMIISDKDGWKKGIFTASLILSGFLVSHIWKRIKHYKANGNGKLCN